MTSSNPYALETLSNLLKGKVIIVTGGNSGIGKSIVEVVARLGARVVIDYRSHPEATEELERELGIRGAIKLASNESAFAPSPLALAAAAEAAADSCCCWTHSGMPWGLLAKVAIMLAAWESTP